MKISINVLPDEQKKSREIENKIGIILRFSASLVSALLFLAVVFFVARIILRADYHSAKVISESRSSQSSYEVEQAEKLLSDVNSASKKITGVSGEIPHWSPVLKKISEICPEEIRINLIHAEKEHIKISGLSKTREAFLIFQDKLKSEGFKNPISPPSNIVSPRDLIFELEFDLDKNFLNQK